MKNAPQTIASLFRDWEQANVAFSSPRGAGPELIDRMEAIEEAMIQMVAYNYEEVVVKLRMLAHDDLPEIRRPDLAKSALADLERILTAVPAYRQKGGA